MSDNFIDLTASSDEESSVQKTFKDISCKVEMKKESTKLGLNDGSKCKLVPTKYTEIVDKTVAVAEKKNMFDLKLKPYTPSASLMKPDSHDADERQMNAHSIPRNVTSSNVINMNRNINNSSRCSSGNSSVSNFNSNVKSVLPKIESSANKPATSAIHNVMGNIRTPGDTNSSTSGTSGCGSYVQVSAAKKPFGLLAKMKVAEAKLNASTSSNSSSSSTSTSKVNSTTSSNSNFGICTVGVSNSELAANVVTPMGAGSSSGLSVQSVKALSAVLETPPATSSATPVVTQKPLTSISTSHSQSSLTNSSSSLLKSGNGKPGTPPDAVSHQGEGGVNRRVTPGLFNFFQPVPNKPVSSGSSVAGSVTSSCTSKTVSKSKPKTEVIDLVDLCGEEILPATMVAAAIAGSEQLKVVPTAKPQISAVVAGDGVSAVKAPPSLNLPTRLKEPQTTTTGAPANIVTSAPANSSSSNSNNEHLETARNTSSVVVAAVPPKKKSRSNILRGLGNTAEYDAALAQAAMNSSAGRKRTPPCSPEGTSSSSGGSGSSADRKSILTASTVSMDSTGKPRDSSKNHDAESVFEANVAESVGKKRGRPTVAVKPEPAVAKVKAEKILQKPAKDTSAEKKPNKKVVAKETKITCMFCGWCTETKPKYHFQPHPYVPQNFQGAPYQICDGCLSCYNKTRTKYWRQGKLLLEGYKNEETCAFCADIPETDTVMCSGEGCARSFCSVCLSRLITPEEQVLLADTDDWLCMCCVAEGRPVAASDVVYGEEWSAAKLKGVTPVKAQQNKAIAEAKFAKPVKSLKEKKEKKSAAPVVKTERGRRKVALDFVDSDLEGGDSEYSDSPPEEKLPRKQVAKKTSAAAKKTPAVRRSNTVVSGSGSRSTVSELVADLRKVQEVYQLAGALLASSTESTPLNGCRGDSRGIGGGDGSGDSCINSSSSSGSVPAQTAVQAAMAAAISSVRSVPKRTQQQVELSLAQLDAILFPRSAKHSTDALDVAPHLQTEWGEDEMKCGDNCNNKERSEDEVLATAFGEVDLRLLTVDTTVRSIPANLAHMVAPLLNKALKRGDVAAYHALLRGTLRSRKARVISDSNDSQVDILGSPSAFLRLLHDTAKYFDTICATTAAENEEQQDLNESVLTEVAEFSEDDDCDSVHSDDTCAYDSKRSSGAKRKRAEKMRTTACKTAATATMGKQRAAAKKPKVSRAKRKSICADESSEPVNPVTAGNVDVVVDIVRMWCEVCASSPLCFSSDEEALSSVLEELVSVSVGVSAGLKATDEDTRTSLPYHKECVDEIFALVDTLCRIQRKRAEGSSHSSERGATSMLQLVRKGLSSYDAEKSNSSSSSTVKEERLVEAAVKLEGGRKKRQAVSPETSSETSVAKVHDLLNAAAFCLARSRHSRHSKDRVCFVQSFATAALGESVDYLSKLSAAALQPQSLESVATSVYSSLQAMVKELYRHVSVRLKQDEASELRSEILAALRQVSRGSEDGVEREVSVLVAECNGYVL